MFSLKRTFSFKVKIYRKRVGNWPLPLRKATAFMQVAMVSLHGGLEKPWHELCWRPQDIRDARTVGHLLSRAANRVWNQPKKECIVENKAERRWRSEECFDIRHEDAEFGVCPAEFWSCFGPVFPHYAHFPQFWNGDVDSVPLEVCDLFLFWFYRGLQLDCHEAQKKLWILAF